MSRVVDYLETDEDIDTAKIIAVGHSRSGKTALYHIGRIGYHRKTGDHGLVKYDWNLFMDFADENLI